MYFQPDPLLLEEILESPQSGTTKLINALNSKAFSTLNLSNLLLPYPDKEKKKALLYAVATALKSTQVTALDVSGNELTGKVIAALISDTKGSPLTKIHVHFNGKMQANQN